MGKLIIPSSFKLFRRTRRMEIVLVAYFVTLIGIMVSVDGLFYLIYALAVGIAVYVYYMMEQELRLIVKTISFDNLGVRTKDPKMISSFIGMFITNSLLMIASIAFVFRIQWYLCLFVFLAYFLATLGLMIRTQQKTTDPMTQTKIEQQRMERDGLLLNKKRQKEQSTEKVARDLNSIEVPLPRLDDEMNWDSPNKSDERRATHIDEAQRRADPDNDDKWRRL